MSGARTETSRLALAGLAGMLGILLGLASDGIGVGGKLLFLLLLVIAASAAIGVHFPGLRPQILARAVWRSNLWVGTFMFLVRHGSFHPGEAAPAWGMVAGCAAALVLVGPLALDAAAERDGYAPAASRSSLLLLMVRGLADAQTLLVLGIVGVTQRSHDSDGLVLLVGSVALLASVAGVYRLAFWGVALNAVTCAILLVGSVLPGWTGVDFDRDWPNPVSLLSILELTAAAPIVFSRLVGGPHRWVMPAALRRAFPYAYLVLTLVLCAVLSAGAFPPPDLVGGARPRGGAERRQESAQGREAVALVA